MDTPVGHGSRIASRPSQTDIDEREFRRTLGQFCTGVAVITTVDGEPVGFTCQSLTSLSLDPPLVTFAVANGSRSLPRLLRTGVFSANVLCADQEPLGRRFGAPHPDRFAGVDWLPAPVTGTPQLAGALAWVEALVSDAVPAGDHTIVIGRVVGVRRGGGDPLLYFGGEFRVGGVGSTQ
ncbi:flavin reductase family protein [Streptomyces mirabilis]|uniref:flavin reductase family protein n=1 Tax=Streptomyces mirabilis TaxID=68239 RepID=UPI001BB07B4D|nr:flavin reductase family protein [Streptomyces mirabilis]QUW79111.1 flavin reductase family protein [Streptomyces mirabilis]